MYNKSLKPEWMLCCSYLGLYWNLLEVEPSYGQITGFSDPPKFSGLLIKNAFLMIVYASINAITIVHTTPRILTRFRKFFI